MTGERGASSMSMGRGVSPFGALQRCPLFAGLAHADVVAVSVAMAPRTFAAGAVLHQAGEPADRLFVVIDGLVRFRPEGARLRRGEVTGADALLTGEPHATTAVAATATEVLELDRDAFAALAARHPTIPVNAVRILRRRLARSHRDADRARQRGEAVALLVGAGLTGSLPAIERAAAAASPGSVAFLDTREGFHEAVAQLDDRLDDHATVVVVARAGGQSAPLLLDHVDRAAVLVEEAADAARFTGASSLSAARMEVVLVGDGPSRPGPAGVARVLARGPGDGLLGADDVAWLGRLLTGTRLGLALGAGGAKGYAHVGAIGVLEAAGYVVDAVAGSSIGALVGAYLALGRDAAAIEGLLRERFDPEAVGELFSLSLAGTSTGLDAMTAMLQETTDHRTFDELAIPFVAMTVDLVQRAPAPLADGPLWQALLAATALAGMFPPQERDGQRLVDGLALVPVPTEAAYAAGADVVVSVNLMPRETLAAWPGQEPPPPPAAARRARLLDTILEVMDVSQLEASNQHAELADVVLHPRFGPASWRDFHLADLFFAAGQEAAREQLAALGALARPTRLPASQGGP